MVISDALCGRRVAGNFTETEQGEVRFPEISAPILEKVCQYFYYKLRYQNECAWLACAATLLAAEGTGTRCGSS